MDTLNYALDSAIISSNVYNWLLYGSGNEGRMVPILDGKYGIGTEIIGVCPLPP